MIDWSHLNEIGGVRNMLHLNIVQAVLRRMRAPGADV
jgi:hypothetical protein